jgi:glyoxylase-like metal-dependent hydrolase (beta-lactamase superfamily II)
MLNTRELGHGARLHQIIEIHGPTHDAQWMLPGLSAALMEANSAWLQPSFWMRRTNRLVFTFQLLVLEVGGEFIVIDTGIGNGKERVAPSQHMVNTPVPDWLAAIGATPERVRHVINTHLHGDHVGWNTRLQDGEWVPMFPNATYYMPRINWDIYKARFDAGKLPDVFALPFADSVIPVVEAGLAKFVDDGEEAAGLTAIDAHGHTPGNMVFSFRHMGDEYIFSGDVIHSPAQILSPEINSRWCEDQPGARASRDKLLRMAAKRGANIIPAHAKDLAGWRVSLDVDGNYSLDIAAAVDKLTRPA